MAQSKHELSKVATVRNQYSTFASGDLEYCDIRKVRPIDRSDPRRIMARCVQVCGNSRITTCVDQKFQG